MAHHVSVKFEAADLIKGLRFQLTTAIGDAVEQIAAKTMADWKERVASTAGVRQALRDRYAASINYSVSGDRMSARIWSDDPVSDQFETGFPARDLKRALDTSEKVRVVKHGPHAGQRYLIIPFRHGTPGNNALAPDMPRDVHRQAMALEKSRSTGMIPMRSGLNASNVRTRGPLMTMRSTYQWGGRLNGPNVPSRLRGMVRMDTSSGKQNRSTHMTFRAMTQWSPGWIVPAQPGRYIVKGLAEDAQQLLEFGVRDALASIGG